jgi:hypothetical protein
MRGVRCDNLAERMMGNQEAAIATGNEEFVSRFR